MRLFICMITAALVVMTAVAPTRIEAKEIDGYPVFESYEDLRETLITLIKNREIKRALEATVGTRTLSLAQMSAGELQIRAAVPKDLTHHSTIQHTKLDNGWGEEIIAFWRGTSYFFANIKYHVRDDGVVAVSVDFNTSLDSVLPGF